MGQGEVAVTQVVRVEGEHVDDMPFWIETRISLKLPDCSDVLQWTIQKYNGNEDGEGGFALFVFGKAQETFTNMQTAVDSAPWEGVMTFVASALPADDNKARVLRELEEAVRKSVLRLLSN